MDSRPALAALCIESCNNNIINVPNFYYNALPTATLRCLGNLCFTVCKTILTTVLITTENVCCCGSQDYMQAVSAEKLRDVEFVQ